MRRARRVVTFDATVIDAIFSSLDQDRLPGATVGVAIEGSPCYRKGFGVAHMELPVLLSPRMRLRIGSTSKQFTALAYLLLCEEGAADLDDAVGRYLDDLHAVCKPVTMRELLSHTGGLRDVHEVAWQFSGTSHHVSSEELVAAYRTLEDRDAPRGGAWIYNNGGYLLVSAVIERITGQTLEDVLRERIFEPLGMRDTLLRRVDTDFVANSATLHMIRPDGSFTKSYLGTALAGEGGIVSTVDDLLRWLAHMDSPTLGTAKTWDILKTPHRLADGTSTGYGLGLITETYRGLETLSHPGGVLGGNAQILKVPSASLDVVVLVNRHDVLALRLANAIVDACVPGLEGKERPGTLTTYGTFQSRRTHRVIELKGGMDEPIASIDGFDLQCVCADRIMKPIADFRSMKYSITLPQEDALQETLQFEDFGVPDEFGRVDERGHSAPYTFQGLYRSGPTATDAVLTFDQELRLRTVGRFGSVEFVLLRLGDLIWRARARHAAFPLGGILVFSADRASFTFSSLRLRALPFTRVQ